MTNEKAKSKSQQRFFGMVDAYKKGEMPDASPAIKKTADGMTNKEVKDFAKTKHKGLPNHVKKKKTIKESQLREMIRNILMESYLGDHSLFNYWSNLSDKMINKKSNNGDLITRAISYFNSIIFDDSSKDEKIKYYLTKLNELLPNSVTPSHDCYLKNPIPLSESYYDGDGDYAGQTWSSYQDEPMEMTQEQDALGRMEKVTIHGEETIQDPISLSDYNKYCKEQGFRFKRTQNLIGGYFVDNDGNSYMFYPSSHKQNNTITESQLSKMIFESIKKSLNESYLDYVANQDEKQQEIESDWNDIDSWNSERPTDSAWHLSYQKGSDTYGKYPGIDYDADNIDRALEDDRYANNNVHDEDGFGAMRAMDRLVKDKNLRSPISAQDSGRRARGVKNLYSDTSTFDDEIDKYNLNIPKDKIQESVKKILKKYIK